jgi:lipoprotein NlpI
MYACIWLIQAQYGTVQDANEELEKDLFIREGTKTNEWAAITARFFIGKETESNYIALATTSAKRPSAIKGQVCEAFYYAGMKRKLAGDTQGAAGLFQESVDTKQDNSFSWMNARDELRTPKKP